MAVSASSTLLGTLQSIARAVAMSTAGATSIDVLTVNHGLGASPDKVIPVIRSVTAVASAGQGIQAVAVSWNASTATIHLPAAHNGAVEANIDVICEIVHSLVK